MLDGGGQGAGLWFDAHDVRTVSWAHEHPLVLDGERPEQGFPGWFERNGGEAVEGLEEPDRRLRGHRVLVRR